jgi:hypothetical protein
MKSNIKDRIRNGDKLFFKTISACKFNFDLSSVIEETARRAAVPGRTPKSSESSGRTPKTSESSEVNFEKKRSNRYSENSDGGSSDSSGLDVRLF